MIHLVGESRIKKPTARKPAGNKPATKKPAAKKTAATKPPAPKRTRAPEPKAVPSIVDALAGRTVFLTGVTGFLGQVVLERLLGEFPDTRVLLLVRSQTGATSVERVHYLMRKPSFDALRERLGGADALLALLGERVTVVDGDFSREPPDLPSGIDVAIHSAAAVSFDPPIDEGFQTNLLGARNLYEGI